MSCSTGSSCGCGSNKLVLSEENLETQIKDAVTKLQKGEEILLSYKTDFSQNLISVMNTNFPGSKIKAMVLKNNDQETIIQLVKPETEESCCGFCS